MDNLCSHLRGLCYGIVPVTESRLKRFIGKLEYISDTSTYVDICKELANILMKRWADQFEYMFLDMEAKPHWQHENYQRGLNLITYLGDEVRVYHRFKEPFLNALITMDPRRVQTQKVWSGLMRLHTAREGLAPTRAERDEIYKSISHKPVHSVPSVWTDWNMDGVLDDIINVIGKDVNRERSYLPLYSYPPNTKTSFVISPNGSRFTRPRTDMLHYLTKGVLRIPEILEIYDTDPEEFIAAGFTGIKIPGSFIDFNDNEYFEKGQPLGKVSSINERGNKHRVVANPNMFLNILGYPLAQVITKFNRLWPCQGFDSHEESVKTIQRVLANSWNGKPENRRTFHSIDMKSFTDYLPYWDFQRRILLRLREAKFINDFDIKVMDTMFSAPYMFLDTGKTIQYGTGTQQGSFPSFPLATFSNGVMLAAASKKVGYPSVLDLDGMVIGDDTTIWDDHVAGHYRWIADRLGLIISEDKSVSSQHVCEMCSKVISPLGYYEKKKLKEVDFSKPESFIEDLTYYGPAYLSKINEQYAKVVEYLGKVPQPYGVGRDIGSVSDDLELCSKISLDPRELINPYEMRFLLSHLENMVEKYIDAPLDKESIHLMRQRLKYYPEIVLPFGQDNLRKPANSEFRDFLRHWMINDLRKIRFNRRSKQIAHLDGLLEFPNPEETKILSNVMRDVRVLNERAEQSGQRLGLKSLAVPHLNAEGEPDPVRSVHQESFHFFEQNEWRLKS